MVPAETDTCDLIVAAARGWIGTPYQHQASLKSVGCDCLGLVRGIWREVYGREPEATPAYTPDWAEAGKRETLLKAAHRHMLPVPPDQCQPGDLLVFRWKPHVPAKHLAISTPQGRMIHAQEGCCVCEVAVNPWWQRHMTACFCFPVIRN